MTKLARNIRTKDMQLMNAKNLPTIVIAKRTTALIINRTMINQRTNSTNRDMKQPSNKDQEIKKMYLISENSIYALQLESGVTNPQKFQFYST